MCKHILCEIYIFISFLYNFVWSVLNKKIACIFYDPSYFGKIINILQILQVVCKMLATAVVATWSDTTFTNPFVPRATWFLCGIDLVRGWKYIFFRKSGLCWDGSMIQLLQIYQLHIHDVNQPFLHIPKGLFWDLETVEGVRVHWTSRVCVHVFMH